MQTIVLASANKHKIKEFKEIFTDYNIVPMAEVGFCQDVEETGTTFYQNAMIKALALREYLDLKNLDYFVIADDSGLCVNALNGAPGVYSARYSGDHNDTNNRAKLLQELNGVADRSAYFMCSIVMLDKDKNCYTGSGKVDGTILTEETGDKSFGFDCLFLSSDLNKCFGLCTPEEKNSVSHRGRAIQDLLNNLKNNNYTKV